MRWDGACTAAIVSIFAAAAILLLFLHPQTFGEVEPAKPEDREPGNSYQFLDDPERAADAVPGWQAAAMSKLTHLIEAEKIDRSQEREITWLIEQSMSDYRDYQSSEGTVEGNESLYWAVWNADKARKLGEHYEYTYCVSELRKTASQFGPWFYHISAKDIESVRDLIDEQRRFTNWIEYYEPDNVQEIIRRIRGDENVRQDEQRALYECEQLSSRLGEELEHQRQIIRMKLVALAVVMFAAFLLGRYGKRQHIVAAFDKAGLATNNMADLSKSLWPKTVRVNSIESILKVGSVITTIAAILTLFVSTLNVRGSILWVSLFCVTALLLSVLSSVVAVNSKATAWKRIAFYTFVVGMLLFVTMIALIILGVGIQGFSSSVREAMTAFLNQTAA